MNKLKRLAARLWAALCRLGYTGGAHAISGGPSLPPPLTPEQEKALLARMAQGDLAARLWAALCRLGYTGGAHAISGGPSLPPPLTPEQEKALLARMAQGDPAARDELITHNLRLVVYLAKKYESSGLPSEDIVSIGSIGLIRMAQGDPAARDELITHNLRLVVYLAKKYESSGLPSEDIVSIGSIGLIKAVNTFTPERNIKLATYASRCIGNEILMYLRKSSNRRQEASIDEPLNVKHQAGYLRQPLHRQRDPDVSAQKLQPPPGSQHRRAFERGRRRQRAAALGCTGHRRESSGAAPGTGCRTHRAAPLGGKALPAGAADHGDALWTAGRGGAHPERSRRCDRHQPELYLPAGKTHHPPASPGAGTVCIAKVVLSLTPYI